jgi:hypothetical protein
MSFRPRLLPLAPILAGTLAMIPSSPAETSAEDRAIDAAARTLMQQCREASFDSATYWTSQPGALRTFDRTTGHLRALHKLYSAPELTITNVPQLAADRPSDWASRPDHYVDLNAPTPDDGGLIYPIADPRSDAEGFSFTPAVGPNPLPFPVAWLYLTRDGTLGPLDDNHRFVPVLNPRTGTAHRATSENPIVARLAWWADDATCKININTASEGVFWDTPRCDTDEERAYGRFQPARGEWQRDMGHPAAVCLSSVLFPGQRLHLPSTTSRLVPLPLEFARTLWFATPGVPDAGSLGGSVAVDHRPAGKVEETISTLHHSLDSLAATPGLPEAAQARLHRADFFLTPRSRALEATRDGRPRISLWPLKGDPGSTAGPGWSRWLSQKLSPSDTTFTEFDGLMALASSVPRGSIRLPLAVVRASPEDPNADLYWLESGSNRQLAASLQTALDATVYQSRTYASKFGSGPQSDAGSLMAAMVEYIRQTNIREPELRRHLRFGDELRAATSLLWDQDTPGQRQRLIDATRPFPRGLGAFPTVTEVALHVSLRNKLPAGLGYIPHNTFYGDNQQQASRLGPWFDHYEIQVGLLIETFSPSQSGPAVPPAMGFTLMGFSGADVPVERVPNTNSGIPAQDLSVGTMSLSGKRLAFPGAAITLSTASSWSGSPPADWHSNGGTLGVRGTDSLISFKPIVSAFDPREFTPLFTFSGSRFAPEGNHLRLLVYALHPEPAGSEDMTRGLVQSIPLAFPEINRVSMPLPFNDSNPAPLIAPLPTGGAAAGKGSRLARARLAGGGLYGADGLIHAEHDIVQSLVPNHGDFRLLASKFHVAQGHEVPDGSNEARQAPTFVAHPNYGIWRLAHSLTEPVPAANRALRTATPYTSAEVIRFTEGYFMRASLYPDGSPAPDLALDPGYWPDYPVKPLATTTPQILVHPLSTEALAGGAVSGGQNAVLAMGGEYGVFDLTRYDRVTGETISFSRGAARPDVTGDFDNGVAATLDGPYINAPDAGDARASGPEGTPYFDARDQPWVDNPGTFSPYRQVPSAMMFGSLPTGVMSNVPWQTLLFRPDAARGTGAAHFGSTNWPDHLVADFFRMPVVKPSTAVDWSDPEAAWKPSDAFSTEGRLNMNCALVPFDHVRRTTALHALFKAQKILAIPDEAGAVYKTGAGARAWRRHIDADETLRQWESRFASGDVFHTTSEIAEQWLVPEGVTLETTPAFWARHRLTGDNSKERPYANIYPHLTTKSLTYELHVVAEPILKAEGTPDDTFVPGTDALGPRVRQTIIINGRVDPRDPALPVYTRPSESAGGASRPLDSLIEWSADPASLVPTSTTPPTFQNIRFENDARALTLSWTAAPGQTCEIEASSDLKNWESQGRFRTGEIVDAPRGRTRRHDSPDTAEVRLAAPFHAQVRAWHVRLRWVPKAAP